MAQRTCSFAGCDRPHRSRGFCNMHYQRWWAHGDPAWGATHEARFWAKAEPTGDAGCWEWQGQRLPSGYGLARHATGSKTTAHRVAWTLANGPVSPGLQVCHRCDNPPCVNPDHLFLGTRDENMADMVEKDRSPRGVRHGGSRLTEDDVREIRRLWAAGKVTQPVIARQFGVSQASISNIVQRKSWRHVA